jgi:hypothetical protein
MEAKQRALRRLQLPPLCDDRRSPALGEKLVERETETALAAVGVDGRLRIVRRHQRLDGAGADALWHAPRQKIPVSRWHSRPDELPHWAAWT